jgi:hypothetical protein
MDNLTDANLIPVNKKINLMEYRNKKSGDFGVVAGVNR